jgi:hypothetical protein
VRAAGILGVSFTAWLLPNPSQLNIRTSPILVTVCKIIDASPNYLRKTPFSIPVMLCHMMIVSAPGACHKLMNFRFRNSSNLAPVGSEIQEL